MTGQEDFAGPLTPQGSWPGDPARPHTPAARTAREVAELAEGADALDEVIARQSD